MSGILVGVSDFATHFVVALMAEARPLIESWELEPSETSPFRVFEGNGVRLVVSGVGRDLAAAATEHLGSASGDSRAVWLNLGICGHPEIALGEVRSIHKVVEDETGEAWYPPAVAPWPWPSIELHTVRSPALDYPRAVGYDMEGSGFVAAARRFATAELVQLVKVVSDNRDSPPRRFRPREVADLVRPHLVEIDGYLQKLHALARETPGDLVDDALFADLVSRSHFTVSRRRQLRDVLRRAAALDITVDPEDLEGDAGDIVETLRDRVERTAPSL